MGWIRTLILVCACTGIVAAQERGRQNPDAATLQLGTPIERTINPGQIHTYQVIADENTLIQITVEQRGIDVLVRIRNPSGKKVAEYDSPNGADGPENVSFVTTAKVPYFIDITPLDRDGVPAGRYEIRLIEQRPATEQEIKDSKNQEALKALGLALLAEIEGPISELRVPQTRIKAQMQAAGLLFESDDKRALKYVTDAITGYRELASKIDPNNKQYMNAYNVAAGIRFEIISLLTVRQPEMALNFLRSTPPLADPWGNNRDQSTHEASMEIEIANQLAKKDPKRSLEIARENLKTRISSALTSTISNLRQDNPEMAAELAGEVVNKLLSQKLTRDSQSASLMLSLVHMSVQDSNQTAGTNGSPRRPPLISDQQRKDLLQKALTEALGFKQAAMNVYTPERDYAWSLLSGLQSLGPELEAVMSGSHALIDKKLKEFNSSANPSMVELQKYADALNDNNMPVEDVIQLLSKAPQQQRDQYYIQLANRLQNNGDVARAKQIVNDYVTAPYQRQQALTNLEMQQMYNSMQKGKMDDALRNVANLPTPDERAQALSQMASQIGPGYKRAAALALLDQARGMLTSSNRAHSQTELNAMLEIAKAYSRYDAKRAFEIIDPLVDQFNDISAAARTLEGFGGEYFEEDELILQNGNVVGNIATQLSGTLGMLALTNFDRSKATAERLNLPEVRLRVYLEIASQAIMSTR